MLPTVCADHESKPCDPGREAVRMDDEEHLLRSFRGWREPTHHSADTGKVVFTQLINVVCDTALY